MSNTDEMKTMLLHLHIMGYIDATDWDMKKLTLFAKARDRDYIEPTPTNLEDWDWVITKKGLEYLEQHK